MKPQLVPLFTGASSLTSDDAYRKLTSPTAERELLLSVKPLTLHDETLVTFFEI